MQRVHELKTLPHYFDAVWSGDKTFEVRYDDRGYQTGDAILLREWDQRRPCPLPATAPPTVGAPVPVPCLDHHHLGRDCLRYTGREVLARIGYVLASTPPPNASRPGFQGRGYVVLALVDPELSDSRRPTSRDAMARVHGSSMAGA